MVQNFAFWRFVPTFHKTKSTILNKIFLLITVPFTFQLKWYVVPDLPRPGFRRLPLKQTSHLQLYTWNIECSTLLIEFNFSTLYRASDSLERSLLTQVGDDKKLAGRLFSVPIIANAFFNPTCGLMEDVVIYAVRSLPRSVLNKLNVVKFWNMTELFSGACLPLREVRNCVPEFSRFFFTL